jgi:SSS family solute:Na+ symporter
LLDLYYFPILFLLSIVGCLAGTLLTPPTDVETLKQFYRTVRPWGLWKPIHELVVGEDPDFKANKRFGIDMLNVSLGILGQLCLTLLPMYLVLMKKGPLGIVLAIFVVIVIILKKTWWNRLED